MRGLLASLSVLRSEAVSWKLRMPEVGLHLRLAVLSRRVAVGEAILQWNVTNRGD